MNPVYVWQWHYEDLCGEMGSEPSLTNAQLELQKRVQPSYLTDISATIKRVVGDESTLVWSLTQKTTIQPGWRLEGIKENP